nr:MAG TPA: hypothetical protein [Bacteriophage sp.]
MKHLWSCRDSILSYKMMLNSMTTNGSINGPWFPWRVKMGKEKA